MSAAEQITFIKYLNCSKDAKNDEPEPEEHIDLFVDDVEGKNTKTIKLLHCSRRTKLVEGAFCDLEKIYDSCTLPEMNIFMIP